MTESVENATNFGSRVANRISEWAEEHPEATQYPLTDEQEAGEILTAIIAMTEMTVQGTNMDKHMRREVMKILGNMQIAISRREAISYIRELNKTDQLEFLGLEIVVPAIVLQ